MPNSPQEIRCIISEHTLNGRKIPRYDFFRVMVRARALQLHSVRDCITVSFQVDFKNMSYDTVIVHGVVLEVDKETRVSQKMDTFLDISESMRLDFHTAIPIDELQKYERVRGFVQWEAGESSQPIQESEFCFSIHLPHDVFSSAVRTWSLVPFVENPPVANILFWAMKGHDVAAVVNRTVGGVMGMDVMPVAENSIYSESPSSNSVKLVRDIVMFAENPPFTFFYSSDKDEIPSKVPLEHRKENGSLAALFPTPTEYGEHLDLSQNYHGRIFGRIVKEELGEMTAWASELSTAKRVRREGDVFIAIVEKDVEEYRVREAWKRAFPEEPEESFFCCPEYTDNKMRMRLIFLKMLQRVLDHCDLAVIQCLDSLSEYFESEFRRIPQHVRIMEDYPVIWSIRKMVRPDDDQIFMKDIPETKKELCLHVSWRKDYSPPDNSILKNFAKKLFGKRLSNVWIGNSPSDHVSRLILRFRTLAFQRMVGQNIGDEVREIMIRLLPIEDVTLSHDASSFKDLAALMKRRLLLGKSKVQTWLGKWDIPSDFS
eukprot:TRINITY_DN1688_c0_g1_i4.p1 TRINITY_DN1688_c0_g1~~TRINITY_DN1688_c0_g1_i4.p1  ORF type:complete len:565 (-),score=143.48 TRINITY_DN1688_c0_g1_i4:110-1738(-)